ncbi:hypothetical protein [Amycolatopsis sp. NPDC004079]|uniref:hypothetical protein n=1 Tax=Amycolatopsis sp. NPDC004079 TaxID=3154549 RepID=UPI0033A6F3C1
MIGGGKVDDAEFSPELAFAAVHECDEPTGPPSSKPEPPNPSAADNVYKDPGARPSGQSAPATEQGTKNASTGAADEPVNDQTVAEPNPAADPAPYEPQSEPTGPSSVEPQEEGNAPLAELDEAGRASYENIRTSVERVRKGNLDDVEKVLSPREFREMNKAFDEKRFYRVWQMFRKYIEKAVARETTVQRDPNIERLGKPGKREADFRMGEVGIDVTSDSKWSVTRHLRRSCIDGRENLVTYRKLSIGEMFQLFEQA